MNEIRTENIKADTREDLANILLQSLDYGTVVSIQLKEEGGAEDERE